MESSNGYTGQNGKFTAGNPGKPKGAVTKVSAKVRESLVAFIEKNIDKVQESFDELTPKEKLEFISGILSYAVPKLSSTQVDANIGGGLTITVAKPGDYSYPTHQGSNGIPESV